MHRPTETMETGTVVKARAASLKPSSPSPLVSVVIVNYNASELVTRAVGAALSSAVSVEVFVVDNGSTDDSLRLLMDTFSGDSRLRVIENRANLGFTRGSNIALKQARGSYVVLLNPDCVVRPDTFERVARWLDVHPEAGMAGCLIRNPDGTEQAGCRRAVPTPWRTLVRVLNLNKLFPHHVRFKSFLLNQEPLPTEPVFLEAISGAFMMARREAVEEVGLLDEGYFLHCDDLDWCMRFRAAGWGILFVPDAEVVHYKGVSSRSRPLFVEWHKHKGMVRFYRKFFRKQYPQPLMVLVLAAVWARFALLAAGKLTKQPIARWRDAREARLAPPQGNRAAAAALDYRPPVGRKGTGDRSIRGTRSAP